MRMPLGGEYRVKRRGERESRSRSRNFAGAVLPSRSIVRLRAAWTSHVPLDGR